MKSKKEENEIFQVAPYPSKGWLVYNFASRFTPKNDSSHKGWFSYGPFSWDSRSGKGVRKKASQEGRHY